MAPQKNPLRRSAPKSASPRSADSLRLSEPRSKAGSVLSSKADSVLPSKVGSSTLTALVPASAPASAAPGPVALSSTPAQAPGPLMYTMEDVQRFIKMYLDSFLQAQVQV